MKNYKLLLGKIAWVFAPIVWGSFIWVMGFGPGASFIPYLPLNLLVRVIAIFLIIPFFFTALNNAAKNYEVQCFGYSLAVPSWRVFVIAMVASLVISFTPLFQFDVICSLILGVAIGVVFEELITRAFFVKYSMGVLEFLVFNFASSLSFMYMHTFYVAEGLSFSELMQRGHLGFSFMLGMIVYKTQRIELAIILHMFFNIFSYTIPVCLFDRPWPSMVGMLGALGGFFLPPLFALVYEWTWIPQTTFFVLFLITAVSFGWLHWTVVALLQHASPSLEHRVDFKDTQSAVSMAEPPQS